MLHREVAELLRKYVDGSYYLGDKNRGYDCLSVVLQYCRDLGVQLPTEFEGFTEDNYGARWTAGEGRDMYYKFLSTLGSKIDNINFSAAGDLMIFEHTDTVMAGIYLGNDQVLLPFERGIKVVPFKFYKSKLLEVRRLK